MTKSKTHFLDEIIWREHKNVWLLKNIHNSLLIHFMNKNRKGVKECILNGNFNILDVVLIFNVSVLEGIASLCFAAAVIITLVNSCESCLMEVCRYFKVNVSLFLNFRQIDARA